MTLQRHFHVWLLDVFPGSGHLIVTFLPSVGCGILPSVGCGILPSVGCGILKFLTDSFATSIGVISRHISFTTLT